MRIILHIDFNSYFASVEQQANPRLRGKPIGVTGGDRETRTVLCTASVEAKKMGVKNGMQIWEARKMCPNIKIIPGDSDKYLYISQKFWNILKDFSPSIEIFSIDEVFMELPQERGVTAMRVPVDAPAAIRQLAESEDGQWDTEPAEPREIAMRVKFRIKEEIGEWIKCSIGISYNKLIAKLASSLQKPDGLIIIKTPAEAMEVLDQAQLDDICGIGHRIKKRLFNLGIRNFKTLRKVPKQSLISSFKSYGEVLFNMARGEDYNPIIPFFDKGEVKSIGHRHTIDHDTSDLNEIKQILLKISEMIAVRLRDKKMVGKTIHCWYRPAFEKDSGLSQNDKIGGDGRQISLAIPTQDGLEIFQTAFKIFNEIWTGERIRMIGSSISNLKPILPANLSLLPEVKRRDNLLKVLDKVNHKFGDFTLKRGSLINSTHMSRKPNPFLTDRRFKI